MTILSDRVWQNGQRASGIKVSFEFFPPTSDKAVASLLKTANELVSFEPEFVSVTYGAGGTGNDRSFEAIRTLREAGDINVAAHLTCAGATKRQTDQKIREYAAAGIRHIVALRGDAPGDQPYAPHPGGYLNAADLVAGISSIADFDISVAAYPETHPDAPSRAADIYNLKAKIDAGANRAITQFFFDNEDYFTLLDDTQAAGIEAPIVPGILLIHDFEKVKKFAAMCGATLPEWLHARFEGLENDPDAHRLMAVSVAVEQVLELAAEGIEDFHFFTLNKSALATTVCRSLGLSPSLEAKSAA
ncbi:MAG: methylenetetrahydrofolate reductase [NAD(P)H] [Hyphomicrobiales bacterium]